MRRSWLLLLLAAVLAGLALPAYAQAVTFTHGVASGDVTPTSAITWTRVNTATNPVQVTVSTQSDFSTVAFRAKAPALAANDFTVKIDATGLTPATKYFYRFDAFGVFSPTGTFRTAPGPSVPASVHFTYTGDSDGTKSPDRPASFGNFEVLNAERAENGAFWGYLGDTIYSDSDLRANGPATTLPQYRAAYKENRTYGALRNLFKSTSTYAFADDHEVVNDYDAETVDPTRYATGRKAFLEYMPIREGVFPHDPSCVGDPMFRKYSWGKDVDIIVLDERSCRSSEAVAKQACNNDLAPTAPPALRQSFGFPPNPPAGCLDAINQPGRTMLGPVQKQLLKDALLNSTAKFKFVMNQDPIQQFYVVPYDRWEGYGAERKELLNFLLLRNIKNVTFLTTDTHATLFNQVFVDHDSRPATLAYDAVTGPIATHTFDAEIRSVAGQFGVDAVNGILDYVEEDCRNLDTNSYALVNYSTGAGTSTLTSKDVNGQPVRNRDEESGAPCTKMLGP
jgi:phosphodiesterase/alkaline phosphatase D-like protein